MNPPPKVDCQSSLFNETEQEAAPDAEEPAVRKVNGFYRKNPKTKREELLKDLPVKEVICDVAKKERFCPRRQSGLVPVGSEIIREELEYIPAKLQRVRYIRLAYGCPECKQEEAQYILKAPTPCR